VTRADWHNHYPDNFAARRGLLLRKMQQDIQQNPSVPVRRVYDKVTNSDSGDPDEIPQFSSFKSRLKRHRSQFVPPLPVDIDDVDISDHWATTRRGQRFLNRLDNQWGLAIFTTSHLLRALANSDCVYIDGTFRTAPHPYTQFVTVHGLYNDFVVPMVFCLLNGKTVAQYRQILQRLETEIRRITRGAWTPVRFVLDFELSLFIAIETELPGVPISGCYFNFTQSLWRHIQDEGLAGAYRHSRSLRAIVRKVMAIGFLPVLLIRKNFTMLRNGRRSQRVLRRFLELDDWLDYVQSTYINGNSPFPPAVWNVFNRNSNTRTNNHVEG